MSTPRGVTVAELRSCLTAPIALCYRSEVQPKGEAWKNVLGVDGVRWTYFVRVDWYWREVDVKPTEILEATAFLCQHAQYWRDLSNAESGYWPNVLSLSEWTKADQEASRIEYMLDRLLREGLAEEEGR